MLTVRNCFFVHSSVKISKIGFSIVKTIFLFGRGKSPSAILLEVNDLRVSKWKEV